MSSSRADPSVAAMLAEGLAIVKNVYSFLRTVVTSSVNLANYRAFE
jgi:hypothetical protein